MALMDDLKKMVSAAGEKLEAQINGKEEAVDKAVKKYADTVYNDLVTKVKTAVQNGQYEEVDGEKHVVAIYDHLPGEPVAWMDSTGKKYDVVFFSCKEDSLWRGKKVQRSATVNAKRVCELVKEKFEADETEADISLFVKKTQNGVAKCLTKSYYDYKDSFGVDFDLDLCIKAVVKF